ncbi:hypothetical protein [Bradyrhizobium shewense]|uniref:hypothetical protein n=1 Tax=Bradyrhizobium shewense TaxID=1761772 RepID=UPI001FD88E41|nr:hypothetical protein [Bradyrhizobium shewense]
MLKRQHDGLIHPDGQFGEEALDAVQCTRGSPHADNQRGFDLALSIDRLAADFIHGSGSFRSLAGTDGRPVPGNSRNRYYPNRVKAEMSQKACLFGPSDVRAGEKVHTSYRAQEPAMQISEELAALIRRAEDATATACRLVDENERWRRTAKQQLEFLFKLSAEFRRSMIGRSSASPTPPPAGDT